MLAGGLALGTIGAFVEQAGVDPLTAVAFRCAFSALALLQFVHPAAAIALDAAVHGRVLGPWAWVGAVAMAVGLWLTAGERDAGTRGRWGASPRKVRRATERNAPGRSSGA